MKDDEERAPWPEWSDAQVSSTLWAGCNRTGRKSAATIHTNRPHTASTIEDKLEDLFLDPAGLIQLPLEFPTHTWMRPHHMDPNTSFFMELDESPLDLLTHNKHLVDYQIMRMIMGSIMCLEREAFHRPFPVEFQTDQFFATGGPEWKPWHHVYSPGCRVGRGQTHSLQYNPHGKYKVRLFYLGKWRCITVDDLLPVSEDGQLLLLLSRPQNLWLAVLTKALLRVAALSWKTGNHAVDFTVIHCLTGWIPTVLPCKGCSVYQLWCVCCQMMSSTELIEQAPGCCSEQSEDMFCPEHVKEDLPAVASRVILGVIIHPFVSKPSELYPERMGTLSSLEHVVLVSDARYDSELPSPLWKEYRWKEWAFQKGIITDIANKPTRNIQIYNPLRVLSLSPYTEDGAVANEYWVDFDIFIKNTRLLEVYYKPSYFKYSLQAWSLDELMSHPKVADDIKHGLVKADKTDAKSRAKSKSPKADKSEKALSKSTKKTTKESKTKEKVASEKSKGLKDKRFSITEHPRNLHPPALFYLLIDSMGCKQLYICLSALDTAHPSLTYSHIVVGRLEWHSPTVAPIVSMLSTSASRGFTLMLTPGLHVFRIWHQFPEHFCLQMFSNTTFYIGSKMSIQQMLTFDSVSYEFYGKEITAAFELLLCSEEGGAAHGKAYDHFMSCLRPPHLPNTPPLSLPAINELNQAFEECLTELLAMSTQFAEEVYLTLQDLQIIFLNPVFGEKTLLNIRGEFFDYIQERRVSKRLKAMLLEQEMNQKAAASENKSKGKSKKSDKKAKSPKREVEPSLKSTKTGKLKDGKGKAKAVILLRHLLQGKEKNLLLKDEKQAISLLKKMMTKVPHLRRFYPFRDEDDMRLVMQDYFGESGCQEGWVVVVRCVLNLHSLEEVPCSLHIWSPLEGLVLRLIDNDTQKDIPLGFVENSVAYLSRNQGGYTVCVYGQAVSTTVPWRLRSMGVREEDVLHVCDGPNCLHPSPVTQLPQQTQMSLHGFYIPNKDRLIARCFIDVMSDVMVLLKLQLSNTSASCSFSLTTEAGHCVLNTTGLGYIQLPVLKLSGKKGSFSNNSSEGVCSYLVTVRLLDDSWPLNSAQIRAMAFYKEHLSYFHGVSRSESFNEPQEERNSSLVLKPFTDSDYNFFEKVEKPSWRLTLVADSQKEMPVRLRHDYSVLDRMDELQRQWQSEGLELATCQQLRQDFLNKLSGEGEEDESEETIFHLRATKTDRLAQLYGQEGNSTIPLILESSSSESGSGLTFTSSLIFSPAISEKENTLNRKPSTVTESKGDPTIDPSTKQTFDETATQDHKSMLVQQTGLHRALLNMRQKTQERVKELFKETAEKRMKVLNKIQLAREAEKNFEKLEMDSPKGKRTSGSSPEKSKGKKKSLTGSKKPKSTKGKLK